MFSTSIYKRYTPSTAPSGKNEEGSWCFVFTGNRMLVKIVKNTVSIPRIEDLPELPGVSFSRIYLGELDGKQCFCMEADPLADIPEGLAFQDLRSLLDRLDEDLFLLAGKASQITNWNKANKYCGKCGAITEMKKEEMAKTCPSCGHTVYPRISPAIIIAVIREGRLLLARNKNFKNNMYSLIAGFAEPGETLEDCAAREVREEVGLRIKNIRYWGSQPWPFPDSLMIGFTAEYDAGEISVDGVEIGDAGWYEWDNLPNVPTKGSIAGRIIGWFIDKYGR